MDEREIWDDAEDSGFLRVSLVSGLLGSAIGAFIMFVVMSGWLS